MYAVIKAGAHQYRVREGETLPIDKIDGKPGEVVNFKDVLLIGGENTKVGNPFVSGATVEGIIKEQKRDDKIIVFKYKRRKNYKRKKGHKQPLTFVEISKIKTS